LSPEARQSIPWMPNTGGTRGCVLVLLGQVEEGKALLEEAMRDLDEADPKAFCACFLAVAAARQGRLEEARAYVEAAEKLDPRSVAMPKALKALADCQARGPVPPLPDPCAVPLVR